MKSIFTKLSTILLCGAVAFTGCSDFSADLRDVNERLEELKAEAATKTELASLSAEVDALETKIAEQYATKEEVNALKGTVDNVQNAFNEAKTAIESAIANKADKSEVEKAVNDLKAAVEAAKTELSAALETAKGEFSAALSGILTSIEDLNKSIVELQTQIGEIETSLETLTGDIDAIAGDLGRLATAVEKLTADIKTVSDNLAAYQEKTDKELAGIKTDFDTFKTDFDALKAAFEEHLAETPEYELPDYEVPAELQSELDRLGGECSDLDSRLTVLEEALAALTGRVEALENSLKSIVSVPQILVNGTPAVEFKSLAYVPMTADSDDVPSVDGAADYVVLGSNQTAAYYHFNPAGFDVASAEYAIVSTMVETRAVSEPVATVGSVTKEGDKVRVELIRGKGTDNMFALAVTKGDETIYSDYALVIDAQVTAADLAITDKNSSPLYATLAETEAAGEQISTDSDKALNFADYVNEIDPLFASFGLQYKYSVVYGNATVAEDGTADLSAADGVSIVKVEAVDGDNVVRRGYVKMYVNYVEPQIPGVWYHADATATVQASRIAFEVQDIYAWAKALKDEPNTTEILKQVAGIVKEIAEIQQGEQTQIEKNYLIKEKAQEAYELLNGVPGFVYKYRTFTGTGEADVRVNVLPEIMSVSELKAVIEMIEETYPETNIVSNLAVGIENYLPESIKNNPIANSVLSSLKEFQLSDILENEKVVNLLEAGQALAERLGTSILDYDAINAKLEEIIKNTVGENNYGEAAARIAAEAKARAAAEEALRAGFDAANEQLLVNFKNGTWGQVLDFINVDLNLDNEIVANTLEKLGLTDTVTALVEILHGLVGKAEDLVQYTYDADQIEYTVQSERYVVE